MTYKSRFDKAPKLKRNFVRKLIGHYEKCSNCQIDIWVRPSEKNKKNKFCSMACGGLYRKSVSRFKTNCSECNKEITKYKNPKKQTKSGKNYCSRKCAIIGFKLRTPKVKNGQNVRMWVKARGLLRQCERCGYNKYTDILVIHHVDRNRMNNDIKNLEILCPNCHMIEHRKKPRKKHAVSLTLITQNERG